MERQIWEQGLCGIAAGRLACELWNFASQAAVPHSWVLGVHFPLSGLPMDFLGSSPLLTHGLEQWQVQRRGRDSILCTPASSPCNAFIPELSRPINSSDFTFFPLKNSLPGSLYTLFFFLFRFTVFLNHYIFLRMIGS